MHRSEPAPAPNSTDIYLQKNVPVSCCEIFGDKSAARAVACGDIRLVCDATTGLVSNAAFVSATQRFSGNYNGSQHGSAHFGRYAADLSERLAEKHGLRGKHVVEIGCGDGAFLTGLCQISGARGTGIDPSLPKNDTCDGAVRFLAERLGEQHCGLKPDLIICRHTLEHIGEFDEFLRHVCGLMQKRTDIPFYLDVPDATRIADEGAFWDVYYEHCHYFTPDSLRIVLGLNGFRTEDMHTEFDGQYVCATAYLQEAGTGVQSNRDMATQSADMASLSSCMAVNLDQQRTVWRDWFAERSPKSVVLWGSGSKAVAFLTSLRLDEKVAAVVDINPDKQNSFLAGTGHRVVPPSELVNLSPDFLIIMNPAYVSEIKDILAELSVATKILVLGRPRPDGDKDLPV